jgi:hypothetical protein
VATLSGFVATLLGFVATLLGFVATLLGFVATLSGSSATVAQGAASHWGSPVDEPRCQRAHRIPLVERLVRRSARQRGQEWSRRN